MNENETVSWVVVTAVAGGRIVVTPSGQWGAWLDGDAAPTVTNSNHAAYRLIALKTKPPELILVINPWGDEPLWEEMMGIQDHLGVWFTPEGGPIGGLACRPNAALQAKLAEAAAAVADKRRELSDAEDALQEVIAQFDRS